MMRANLEKKAFEQMQSIKFYFYFVQNLVDTAAGGLSVSAK